MKISAKRHWLGAAVLFSAAAAGFAQDSAPTSSAPIDAEIKSLDAAVSAYKTHVLSYLNKNGPASSEEIDCRRNYSPQGYHPVNVKPDAPFPREIYAYAVCASVSQHLTKPCDDLTTVDTSGQAVVECREQAAQVRMSRFVRSGKPEAAGACREMIAVAAAHMSDLLPPAKADDICRAFITGRDRDEILSQLRPLATKRATPEEENDLAHGIDLALGSGACAPSEANGTCQDISRTARAARFDDPNECGSSALCRAAFVGESACAPLKAEACRAMFGANSESLRAEFNALSPRVQRVLQDAESVEPRSDEANKERVKRARRLHKRFDDVPKWGAKNKPR